MLFFKENTADKIYYFIHVLNKNFIGFVRGQLTDVAILGVSCYVGMKILGLPYGITISGLIMFLALIPIIGSMAGTAVGFILILLDSPSKAILFLIFMIILLQIDSNFIYPKIVGKKISVPPMFTLFSIVVGAGVGGIVGIWIAIPLIASIYTMMKLYAEYRLLRKRINIYAKPDYSFTKVNSRFVKFINYSNGSYYKVRKPGKPVKIKRNINK